uniref:Wall-associated receptor kinase galacturonan-binding domain-containing protein n=1 Tax=Oryza glumipatula TaxID=40148 RepID=A0A0D9Y2Z8_9ORYZ
MQGDLKKYLSQNYRPHSHVFSLFPYHYIHLTIPISNSPHCCNLPNLFSWFPTHPPAMFMFLAPSIWVACSLPFVLSAAAADAQGGGEGCKVGRCGNMSILQPFGLVKEQDDANGCLWFGFQVTCNDSIPYLGYPQKNQPFKFQIIDIFYSNSSLLVTDVRKTDDFDNSSGCSIPRSNTSSKLGWPFSISNVNQNLVFYNCTKAPAAAERRVLGLVDTKCRNNTYAHLEERYNESVHFLEGCDAVIVPVRGRDGEANASNYEQLISDGFFLTWQPPPQQSAPSWSPTSSCRTADAISRALSTPPLTTQFKISPMNRELVFLYNCNQSRLQLLPPSWAPVSCAKNESSYSYAWHAGRYKPDDDLRQQPGSCTVSMIPVLGYDGAAAKDYERLIKGGFLLDYTAGPDDCEDCSRSGGLCRVNVTYDWLECQCPEGMTSFGVMCKFVYKLPFPGRC